MNMPDFKEAFVPMPSDFSDAVERGFERGEEAMKKRHKITLALSIAAVLVIAFAFAAMATGALSQPKPDNVVVSQDISGGILQESDWEETYPVLQKQSRGAEVSLLQKRLNELNYSVGYADGMYGDRTYSMICRFQELNGLEVTGIADEATQVLLYSEAEIGTACDHPYTYFRNEAGNASVINGKYKEYEYCQTCDALLNVEERYLSMDDNEKFIFTPEEFAQRFENICKDNFYNYDVSLEGFNGETLYCDVRNADGNAMARITFFNGDGVLKRNAGGEEIVTVMLECLPGADDEVEVDAILKTLLLTTNPILENYDLDIIVECATCAGKNGGTYDCGDRGYAIWMEDGNVFASAAVLESTATEENPLRSELTNAMHEAGVEDVDFTHVDLAVYQLMEIETDNENAASLRMLVEDCLMNTLHMPSDYLDAGTLVSTIVSYLQAQ